MLFRSTMTAAMLAALAGTAGAQVRPDTREMTCDGTRAMILERGAVVLTTGQHTYERYVAGTRFCSIPDIALQVTVPTRDDAECVVYACHPDPFGD